MGHRSEKDWEGLAFSLWRELEQPEPPMSALQLASDLGVEVRRGDANGGAELRGDVVLVDTSVRDVRMHGLIAHELGHWTLRRGGEVDDEAGASYVGAALMLPRDPFDRDLRETQWDLRALRAKHVNCSAELLARRIVALRDAVATVWDNGQLKGRHRSPWMVHRRQLSRITPLERELAADVLKSGETLRLDGMTWAFPVFSGDWRRVITVVEAEQLGLRW